MIARTADDTNRPSRQLLSRRRPAPRPTISLGCRTRWVAGAAWRGSRWPAAGVVRDSVDECSAAGCWLVRFDTRLGCDRPAAGPSEVLARTPSTLPCLLHIDTPAPRVLAGTTCSNSLASCSIASTPTPRTKCSGASRSTNGRPEYGSRPQVQLRRYGKNRTRRLATVSDLRKVEVVRLRANPQKAPSLGEWRAKHSRPG